MTGGYAGVGLELCKILYAHNATVWIAGRSEAKAQKAIASIREASQSSKGSVQFLSLDLSDFATIKPAVELFTAKEQRLDVLVNNAGVCLTLLSTVMLHVPMTDTSTGHVSPRGQSRRPRK